MRAMLPLATKDHVTIPRAVLIAIAALLVMATGWAVINQARVSSLQADVEQLRQDIALLRQNATATAYTFEPTDIAPPNLRGSVYIATSGSGVVTLSNLPPTGDDHSFQVWLLDKDGTGSPAGKVFLTPTGEGFALIPADSSGYTQIAISLEPDGASSTPGSYLLVVDVNPARGDQSLPVQERLLCQNHSE